MFDDYCNYNILTTHFSWVNWTALGLCLAILVFIYILSILSSAVESITEAEARILHNRKSRAEQRVYKFFKRKQKVLASLSAAETLLVLVFIMGAVSFVHCDSQLFQANNFVFLGNSKLVPSILFFVLLAFTLVIAVVVPGRIISDVRKHAFLLRLGWMVDSVCTIMKPVSFCDAYANREEESDSRQLSAAIGAHNGNIGEKDIIRNILQFGDIEVREIMTPRHDIVAIKKNSPFSQVKRTVVESNFSRLPVYENTPDSIFGIVYVKDLLKHVGRGDDFDWSVLIRRITYVSENKKISDLLKEFQQNKTHMAAVCDEYAGISGLITMQDILEKIVGEISDEFDEEDDGMYIQKDDGYFVFDGRILLGDFCRVMRIDDSFFDDVRGDAESLAGVLLEMRGEFPDPNVPIKFRNFSFSVEKFSGRRIEKIGVRIK